MRVRTRRVPSVMAPENDRFAGPFGYWLDSRCKCPAIRGHLIGVFDKSFRQIVRVTPFCARSFFNAATEVLKGINPNTVVHRTPALHGLFHGLVGLS